MNCLKVLFSSVIVLSLVAMVTVVPVSADTLPEKVSKFYAVQQDDAIQLRWQAVHGACDGYRIYHEAGDALQPGSFWFDVKSTPTSSLFRDVVVGQHYTFRISALYGNLEGPLSAPVTVSMQDKNAAGPRDAAQ